MGDDAKKAGGDGAKPQAAAGAMADPKKTYIAVQWKHGNPLINCRFDPTGKYVFATSEDRSIVRWELATGKKIAFTGHDSWVRGLAFSNDGKTLVTSGYDDQLIWWPADADKPEPIRKIKAHAGWIRAVAVSPDGKLLVSGGNDGKVRLWQLDDGKPVRDMPAHDSHIYSVAFDPTGGFVLAGDLLGAIKQSQVADGKLVRSFDAKPLHTYNSGQAVDYGGVRSFAFSPDGKQLAASGLHKASNPLGAVNEPLVLVYNWADTKKTHTLTAKGVRGIGWRVVWHPAGFLVGDSGGSGGGYLLFWKTDKAEPFHKLKMPNTAREMDLHRDTIQIATAHHDGHLRISRMAAKPAKKG